MKIQVMIMGLVSGSYRMSNMMLRLYTLQGDFRIESSIEVETLTEATKRVRTHLMDTGYTNLRTKDDADYSIRFIADPPIGRKGRNVAAVDY